jgi:hypothetical protein
VGVEYLAVAEDPVDGIEGHCRVEVLGLHRVGRLGPVHDAAAEHSRRAALLREERIRVAKQVDGLVDRVILHWAFHR